MSTKRENLCLLNSIATTTTKRPRTSGDDNDDIVSHSEDKEEIHNKRDILIGESSTNNLDYNVSTNLEENTDKITLDMTHQKIYTEELKEIERELQLPTTSRNSEYNKNFIANLKTKSKTSSSNPYDDATSSTIENNPIVKTINIPDFILSLDKDNENAGVMSMTNKSNRNNEEKFKNRKSYLIGKEVTYGYLESPENLKPPSIETILNEKENLTEVNESLISYGKNTNFLNTSKYARKCAEKSLDKIFNNSSRLKKTFPTFTESSATTNNTWEEELSNIEKHLLSETSTVNRSDLDAVEESTSSEMNAYESKVTLKNVINTIPNSDSNRPESALDENDLNLFTSDDEDRVTCNTNILGNISGKWLYENPAKAPSPDQLQSSISNSSKNPTCELNSLLLFTEDERDAITKLIIDSDLLNEKLEITTPVDQPGSSKLNDNYSNNFKENLYRNGSGTEAALDEINVVSKQTEIVNNLQNHSEIIPASGTLEPEPQQSTSTNNEININECPISDFSSVDDESTNDFEAVISELPESPASEVDSPLDAENSILGENLDIEEEPDFASSDELLEAELTPDVSQDSPAVEIRVDTTEEMQNATTQTIPPKVVNLLRVEIFTSSLDGLTSDDRYKVERTAHAIENQANMAKLQKVLINSTPKYFEGIDRFNLVQGRIPDIVEVLKAYPDSNHHAHVRLLNPDFENYKNTVSNSYISNKSDKRIGDCPICMYTFSNPVSTWCGHIFCENCLLHAIEYHRQCPTCRKQLCMPYYHKVFL